MKRKVMPTGVGLSSFTVSYHKKKEEAKKLRKLQEEEMLRMQKEIWQKKPLVWLRDRFGEDPLSFKWTARGGEYENHTWDGDEDPLAKAWKDLADGNWVGVEAATGTSKTYWLSSRGGR